jgi:hypothetical protein
MTDPTRAKEIVQRSDLKPPPTAVASQSIDIGAEILKAIGAGSIGGLHEPSKDPESLLKTVKGLKEGYETLMRSRGDAGQSAIRVDDLVAILELLLPYIENGIAEKYGLTPV